ncbi:MAG: DUF389 domain-containing protein [Cyanobacteria bacterium K_Offshore_surface_m2_011]|nr:DUF389 domain-containing protein [Cyanobacteria bacterium K_Offshore_surface_m2_011]
MGCDPPEGPGHERPPVPVPAPDERLAALQQEFEHDASFSQVFVVLTVGAALIATLGLLANSPGVVIGAMVVAPWIMPLQAMAFEILRGRLPMFLRALRTLMLGVVICVLLAMAVGHLVAFPSFGSEVMNRTSPNLLDLGVALVAGAVAMYAKLRKDAISALAGLAIAVALVPPMCVVGILLASSDWMQAYGALLLFATNLLGIMVGAMASLGTLEKVYWRRLFHSRLGLTSVALTALLVIPLGSSFFRLVNQTRQENKAQQLEAAIEQRLRSSTITLGGDPAIDMVGLSIDWQQNPPLIRARVRVTDPELPTAGQVAAVQEFINKSQAPLRFRLVMQRTAVDLIGPETAPNPADLEVLPPPALPPPASPAPRAGGGGGARRDTLSAGPPNVVARDVSQ